METRAATDRYRKIKAGDYLVFVCEKDQLRKKIAKADVFKDITAMLKKYRVEDINPEANSQKDLEKMYFGFSGYKEKIEKLGLVAWKLADDKEV